MQHVAAWAADIQEQAVRRTADYLATLGAGIAGAAVALAAVSASPAFATPALIGIGAFAFVMQARSD